MKPFFILQRWVVLDEENGVAIAALNPGISSNRGKTLRRLRLTVVRCAKTDNVVPKKDPFVERRFPVPETARNKSLEYRDRVPYAVETDYPKWEGRGFVNSHPLLARPTRKRHRQGVDPRQCVTKLDGGGGALELHLCQLERDRADYQSVTYQSHPPQWVPLSAAVNDEWETHRLTVEFAMLAVIVREEVLF